jgi:hypothetical protein
MDVHLITSKAVGRLTGNDIDLRIKNSRVGLSSWTYTASMHDRESDYIARICDTEISLLQGLRGVTADQQVAIDLLLHRWHDLRTQCGQGEAKPKSFPRRRRGRVAGAPSTG